MRNLVAAALMCGASCALAQDPVVLRPPVLLYTAQDLAILRATNPDHYARAARLIAAANRLCQPGKAQLQDADARDISCELLLLTSNPPKRKLSFVLDWTKYVALVTITGDRPQGLLVK
jgi:hypothetical protein